MQNRKYLIIALALVTLIALVLFALSKSVAGTQSDLLLWGVVIMAAATFLAALKDIIELVERYWPKPDKSAEQNTVKKTTPTEVKVESQSNAGDMNQNSANSPYYSCFISYSSKDEEFAQKLHDDLKAAGVECWFAPEDMKIGDKIRPALDSAVLAHHKLLLILSEHSTSSDWVEQEAETAFEKERDTGDLVLFPIRLDDTVFNLKIGWAAHIKRTRHIGDFRNWHDSEAYLKSFQRVLRDLAKESLEKDG